ncbi:MAG: exodeoxyribonuclease VII large subunit [Phycisphaerales bacterium]|nr:exodeoxyribonuclease VII large subunit [Phycisphaerales bacterium]
MPDTTAKPLTVSQLSEQIRDVLEGAIPRVAVQGQVNRPNCTRHWYFTLTDGECRIDCAMWASRTRGFDQPKDGDEVIVGGKVDHYPKGGRTQLIVDSIKPLETKGVMQLQLDALMKDLRELGWFDDAAKKPLPEYSRGIAVITSATSAAAADVIKTAAQRWAAVPLTVVNVPVQGDAAPAMVARAIRAVDKNAERLGIDAIIVTRGGGSTEELWCFNDRFVAKATFECTTPIVAAIGHEIDTTVIELVADRRASTPTQAAMFLVADAEELAEMIDHLRQRLAGSVASSLHARGREVAKRDASLARARPHTVLRRRQERLLRTLGQLQAAMSTFVSNAQRRLEGAARTLTAVGPQAVLQRGFSLTRDSDGNIVRSSEGVSDGEQIMTILADGSIASRVECP